MACRVDAGEEVARLTVDGQDLFLSAPKVYVCMEMKSHFRTFVQQ